VPNPSFEEYDTCPDHVDEVYEAIGWNSYNSTPEYFNACANTIYMDVGVPKNRMGYQYGATGNAYCGIVLSFTNEPYGNREAIGTQLSSQMEIGKKYLVSIKCSLADSINPTRTACNKLGVKFSTVPYDFSQPVPIDNIAHMYTNSIITDSITWTEISGSFLADSEYKYICIGNFFINNNVDTLNLMSELPGVAYYYLDDISVIKDTSVNILELDITTPKVYQNNQILKIENVKNARIQIIDQNGKIVEDRLIIGSFFELSIEIISTAIFYLIIIDSLASFIYKFYKN
jgi:hypothetical protein